MESIKIEFKALVLELIDVPSEEREAIILLRLDKISLDPEYMDYIFHSDEFYLTDDEFDIQALTDKVFNYKPVVL